MNLKATMTKILALFLACTISPISNFAQAKNIRPQQTATQNEISQIEVNCAFPIGPWCICAYHLQRHKLRFQASPLDWMGPMSHKLSKSNFYSLETVSHLFETEFVDFFQTAKSIPKTYNGPHRVVLDPKNNIFCVHYFHRNIAYRIAKKEFRKTMLNRAKKVDEIMKNSDSIALISCRENTKEEFIDFIKKFSKIYPNKKIYLINVHNVNSQKVTRKILYSEENLKIIEYSFKNEGHPYDWRGNYKGWDEVMKSIKLVRK